jgi:MFS family permease
VERGQLDALRVPLADPYPPAARAWVAVFVFFLATVVAIMDRGLLALVIDPIRADLGISDVDIALLQGLAFAVFYTTAGLGLGVIADLVSRRRLLIGGILLWSAATVGCGLARNFTEMFAARLFVGFGEATLAPCAVTLLGDLFPPARRGRPMAIYVLGGMISQGLGSLVSGWILAAAPRGAFEGVPWLGALPPWRISFVVVGAAGVVVAGFVAGLREPRRRGVVLSRRQGLGLAQARDWFSGHWRVLLPFYGVLTSYAFGISVAAAWGPVLLMRNYGFDPASAGKARGLAQIIAARAGAGGAVVASVVVDRVARRAFTPGKIAFAAVLAGLAIPATLAGIAPRPGIAVCLLAAVTFVNAVFGSTMLSSATEMMPVGIKGLAIGLYAFVMSMIGSTLGPLCVAGLTERVFHDPHAVGMAMAIVGCSALLVAAALALFGAREFERERLRSAEFADVVRSNLA